MGGEFSCLRDGDKLFRWQVKQEGKDWTEIAFPHESVELETAFLSGTQEHVMTYQNDGSHKSLMFRRGDPDTLHWKTDFRSGKSWCVENPGRKVLRRRVECDVKITESQLNAILHASTRSAAQALASKRKLDDRVLDLTGRAKGWDQLSPLRQWLLQDAPFIIHVDLGKRLADGSLMIDKFLNDDHYRNLFETGTGGGCTAEIPRARWEMNMFGKAYPYPGTAAFDRPKYGTMNLTGDPRGVVTAALYGTSYFVLRSDLRWRCTMTNKDSCNMDGIPATANQGFMLLESYSDEDLLKIVRHDGRCGLPKYPEIQIHGAVKFNRDIDHLVADAHLSTNVQAKVVNFARRNNFEVIWRYL